MENINNSPFIDDFSVKNEEKVKPGENLTAKNAMLLGQQAEKSVCEIIKDYGYGSGFFCKIKYEGEEMYCLFTNNHVINEYILKNDEFFEIKLIIKLIKYYWI